MFLHPPQPKGLTGRGMTKVQLTYVSRSSVVLVTLLWGQVHELCFQAVQFSGADIYLHDVYRNFIFRKWLRRIEHFEFDTQHLNYWYFAAAGLSLFDIVSNHFSIFTTLKIEKNQKNPSSSSSVFSHVFPTRISVMEYILIWCSSLLLQMRIYIHSLPWEISVATSGSHFTELGFQAGPAVPLL